MAFKSRQFHCYSATGFNAFCEALYVLWSKMSVFEWSTKSFDLTIWKLDKKVSEKSNVWISGIRIVNEVLKSFLKLTKPFKTYQTGSSSSTLTALEFHFRILVAAEIAFSVGFKFADSRASGAWITWIKRGMAEAQRAANPGPPCWPITPAP